VVVTVVDVVCVNTDSDWTIWVVSNVILSHVVETCVEVTDVVVDVLSTLRTVSVFDEVVVVRDVLVVRVYVTVQ